MKPALQALSKLEFDERASSFHHRLICGLYSTSCTYICYFTVSAGRANFFYGNRYVKANDDATRLIFDCDGSLAGMQATVRETDFEFLTKKSQSFLRGYSLVFANGVRTTGKLMVIAMDSASKGD